jgi:pyruvate/2-oxoglutarate dehydrogenase complex dihydrolipoamide acyltransferase (E2) component
MNSIKVATELWASSIIPEGLLEKWLVPDGTFVAAGEAVAAVRIEGALHDLAAPADGWLTISQRSNSVVAPGDVIGHIGGDA